MAKHFIKLIISLFILSFLYSCAKIGSPTGGPVDSTPPVILESEPENFSKNFTATSFEIFFDEFVQLKNPKDELIISPPLEEDPEIILKGKSIKVKINNELRENTTYTFNFGNSIVDNHEGNTLTNFEYVFSTGPYIDSMIIKGRVVNAFNNTVPPKCFILLHDIIDDSAIFNYIPAYVSRTDGGGNFTINNIKADTFLLFGLTDENNNFVYDLPSETIGFIDTMIITNETFYPLLGVKKADTSTVDSVKIIKKVKTAPVDKKKKITDTVNVARSVSDSINPINDSIHKNTDSLDFSIDSLMQRDLEEMDTNSGDTSFFESINDTSITDSNALDSITVTDSSYVSDTAEIFIPDEESLLNELYMDSLFFDSVFFHPNTNDTSISDTSNPDSLLLTYLVVEWDDSLFSQDWELRIPDTVSTFFPDDSIIQARLFSDSVYISSLITDSIFNISPVNDSSITDSILIDFLSNAGIDSAIIQWDSIYIDSTFVVIPEKKYIDRFFTIPLFKEEKEFSLFHQYVKDYKRPEHLKLVFVFNLPIRDSVSLQPLGNDSINNWYYREFTSNNDTLIYWITDTLVSNTEKLKIDLAYTKVDSNGLEYTKHDTLGLAYKFYKSKKKKKDDEEDELKIDYLKIASSVKKGTAFDLNKNITIESKHPVKTISPELIHLYELDDTNEIDIDFSIERHHIITPKDTVEHPRIFKIMNTWEENKKIRMFLEPGAVMDIYGMYNDSLLVDFTTQKFEYYGKIILQVSNVESNLILQLMDNTEKIISENYIHEDGSLEFEYMKPLEYRMKIIYDNNNNYRWDPGDILLRRQPEKVGYFKELIKVRSNWDVELTWEIQND